MNIHYFRPSFLGCVLVFVCGQVFISDASATPPSITQIQGTFSNGATVTITGTGFGVKIPAKPFLWDDYEGEWVQHGERILPEAGSAFTIANKAAIGGYHYVADNPVSYTDSGVFSGQRALYTLRESNQTGFSSRFSWDDGATNAKRAFSSMVIRYKDETEASWAGRGIKMLRINTWTPTPPNFHQYGEPAVWVGKTNVPYPSRLDSSIIYPPMQHLPWYSQPPEEFAGTNDKYFSVAAWGALGNAEDHHGFVGLDFNGTINERHYDDIYGETAEFPGFRNFYFNGLTSSSNNARLEMWIDEVYSDTTLARVTANDLSKAGVSGPQGGQTAMQIPVAWSDSSIQIKVNTGRYSAGTQLAVVVWNASGEKSAPAFVTVADQGPADTTPPMAVSNLRRVE